MGQEEWSFYNGQEKKEKSITAFGGNWEGPLGLSEMLRSML